MKRGDLVLMQDGSVAVLVQISSTNMFNEKDRVCKVLASADSTVKFCMLSALKKVNS